MKYNEGNTNIFEILIILKEAIIKSLRRMHI